MASTVILTITRRAGENNVFPVGAVVVAHGVGALPQVTGVVVAVIEIIQPNRSGTRHVRVPN